MAAAAAAGERADGGEGETGAGAELGVRGVVVL